MTISFVASAQGTDTANGCVVTIPASVLEGDRLYVLVETNSNAGYSHVVPDGWQSLAFVVGLGGGGAAGGSNTTSLMTKIATGADALTEVEFQVTPTGSSDVCELTAYRGDSGGVLLTYGAVGENLASSTDVVPVPVTDVDSIPAWLILGATRKGGTVAHTPTHGTATIRGTANRVSSSTISASLADIPAAATGATSVGSWTYGPANTSSQTIIAVMYEGEPPELVAPIFRRWTVTGWYPPISP